MLRCVVQCDVWDPDTSQNLLGVPDNLQLKNDLWLFGKVGSMGYA